MKYPPSPMPRQSPMLRFVGVLTPGLRHDDRLLEREHIISISHLRNKGGYKMLEIYSNMFSISIKCWNAINWKLPDRRGLTFESNDNFMLICCTLPAGGGVSVSVRAGCNALWPLMMELPGAMMYSCTQVSTLPRVISALSSLTPARCVTVTGSSNCTLHSCTQASADWLQSRQLSVRRRPGKISQSGQKWQLAWCRCNGITAVTSWYQQ